MVAVLSRQAGAQVARDSGVRRLAASRASLEAAELALVR